MLAATLDGLADPVRRRILERLLLGAATSGELVATIQAEFGISQPAVSQHLRALREGGFVMVQVEGPRRIYRLTPEPFEELDAWLQPFRAVWAGRLDALATEVARGKKAHKREAS